MTLALTEDVAGGDITTEACVEPGRTARATLLVRAKGVLAGLDVARLVFQTVDNTCIFEPLLDEGALVPAGTAAAVVRGPARALLTGERVALNFVQRLSGIATLTRRFVDAVAGTGAVILDTRKTTPGMRFLEKYAVRVGGGQNHRFGLFDMYLVKDNHVRAAGSLTAAVEKIRKRRLEVPLEVEAQSLPEVREAVGLGVDRILLDNMDAETLHEAVRIVLAVKTDRRRPEIEVSGGMTLETVGPVAKLGVDFISVGALTHSAPALDLSLEFDEHD